MLVERHAKVMVATDADALMRRVVDVVVAVSALVAFLPLLLVVSAIVALQDGGPILYGQSRVGEGGRLFKCWKFRSMVTDASARLEALLDSSPEARAEWASQHKLKRDPRITPVGNFLRRSSLDELPQLFNVLIGEMSIVGPRPITPAEVCRYSARIKQYCLVKPGITGLWQISGRSNTSYNQRVALDVLYIRRQSAALNLKIILATVPAILTARGSC